ncbi:MAG: flagellar hook protein FlgE [endosymbiont of Galathealinum brachiosum]|uniref:Flagellar hook protein FlgE n=1 Tax=endosymbiont of Galathealinum brachiosum TaxID=2200906 RepID=A0A370DIG3_9GAMM|nr:MAG: flagellar hook protein FlgE [endosymbiont of Galathealinum brachiosum]
MSFNISLSGLNAASSDLDVTSNNVANVSTTGFKGSRAEFSDIFAASPLGTTSNAIGAGVQLASVSQQFGQGNLEFTENTLDMAVSGEGFFVMRNNQTSADLSYTRAGAFQVDENGLVANSAGQILQVFPVDPITGVVGTTSLTGTIPLQVPNTVGSPQATTGVDINLNLPAAISPAIDPAAVGGIDDEFNAAILAGTTVAPNTSNFHNSTSATVFDSQGNSHILTMYYVMSDDLNNTWDVRSTLDGFPMTTGGALSPAVLDFDSAGALDLTNSTTAGALNFDAFTLTNGAAPIDITIDFASQGNTVTQEAQGGFSVQSLSQDGFSTGRLAGLEVDDSGLVRASFTNGQTTALGKVALARFDNPQGLRQTGNTSWVETVDSGPVIGGEAGTGNLGLIQTGALETSNVDLTAELVNLITAQRNFQANSKAIETANTITQTIINIT